MLRVLLPVSILLLAFAATPAVAETDFQQETTFNSATEAESTVELTFTGSDAAQLRSFLDSDGDGNVSQQEAAAFTEGNDEPTLNWTLDGTDPNASFTDQTFENWVGPVAEEPPLFMSLSVKATFPEVEAGDEHTFVDTGAANTCTGEGNSFNADTGEVTVTVSDGFDVGETDPGNATVSGSTVTATCGSIDDAVEVTYTKGSSGLPIPGFGVGALLVAALVGLAARRRRR